MADSERPTEDNDIEHPSPAEVSSEQVVDSEVSEEPTGVTPLDRTEEEAGEPSAEPQDDTASTDQPAVIDQPVETVPKRSKWHWLRPENIFFPALRRKLGSKARLAAIILIVVIVGAGAGGGYWYLTSSKQQAAGVVGSFKAPAKQFKLVSTVPANNATNVNTASDITLNFSQPVKASKLVNNMFITPTVNGTFKQGANPSQVVFVPASPLTQGVKYSIMINGTVQSAQGTQLGIPEGYGFTTSIPGNAVSFADHRGLFDYVTSLPSGQKETYSLYFGSEVGPTANITLYKGTPHDLLTSLVYSNTVTDSGYISSQFSDLSVSTSGLTKVSTTPNVKDKDTYTVQQPDGLYVAVATDGSGKEVGFVWVSISNFGVLLRQDDQKTVLTAQSFADNKDVAAQATFYSLRNSVKTLDAETVDGLTTTDLGYDQNLDMVVATYNDEIAVVPVNVLNSGGDIRVDQNLSTAQTVYGITDKPSYKAGDTVKFAGYVRLDNDAQYVKPASGKVRVYVGNYKGETPLTSMTVPVDSNGMFSGSFTADGNWLTKGDAFDQFQIFTASVSGNPMNDLSVAGFTVAASTNQTNTITVSYSKASYLPSDQINATIKAVNGSGQPLANTSVQVHVFSKDYYENDVVANQTNFGEIGTELTDAAKTVQLDGNGQAVYTVKASSLPSDGNSQEVTVQANLPGQTGVGAAGGDSAVVHQGNGYITFGVSRRQIPDGADFVSDVYASQLNGAPIANSSLKYVLTTYDNSKQFADGTVTTDSNGLAVVRIPSSKLSSHDALFLKVVATDQYGNAILSQTYFSVAGSYSEESDTSGAGLLDLNVSGSSGYVKVGDTVNVTVSSPAALRTLVTMDRGRIYKPSIVDLKQGDNKYSFTVTSDLSPSFTLTFSYFQDGVYHSEGVAFTVQSNGGKAQIDVHAPASVTAGQPAVFQLSSADSAGSSLPAALIVKVVSSDAYALTDKVSPDIFADLYAPRPIMTSSSSSLSPVGSGGGRCGGGDGPLGSFANAVGTTLYWQPGVMTAANGQTNVTVTPPKGTWTMTVYGMSDGTQVGSRTMTFTAN